MICPRCGWQMEMINRHKYSELVDTLYKCICGATHLSITPLNDDDDETIPELVMN